MKKKELLRRIEVLEEKLATKEEKALLEPKEELEVGKWYKGLNNSNQIIFKVDSSYNGVNYGFFNKQWDESWYCSNPDEWLEATPQEVEDALVKEAKKRGYNYMNYTYNAEENELCGIHGGSLEEVFVNGKWVERNDKPQIGDVCKFWDEDEDDFIIGFLERIDFNYLFPYKTRVCCYMYAKKVTEQEVIDLLFKK